MPKKCPECKNGHSSTTKKNKKTTPGPPAFPAVLNPAAAPALRKRTSIPPAQAVRRPPHRINWGGEIKLQRQFVKLSGLQHRILGSHPRSPPVCPASALQSTGGHVSTRRDGKQKIEGRRESTMAKDKAVTNNQHGLQQLKTPARTAHGRVLKDVRERRCAR